MTERLWVDKMQTQSTISLFHTFYVSFIRMYLLRTLSPLRIGLSGQPTAFAARHLTRSMASKANTEKTKTTTNTIAPSVEAPPEPHIKITLTRSLIGLPEKLHRVALGIGLRKRGRSVYKRVTPGVVGSVLKLKEVVSVERVPDHLARVLATLDRPRVLKPRTPPGFTVVGNVLEQQKASTQSANSQA
jgi:large subunit ribosomal protein L30